MVSEKHPNKWTGEEWARSQHVAVCGPILVMYTACLLPGPCLRGHASDVKLQPQAAAVQPLWCVSVPGINLAYSRTAWHPF